LPESFKISDSIVLASCSDDINNENIVLVNGFERFSNEQLVEGVDEDELKRRQRGLNQRLPDRHSPDLRCRLSLKNAEQYGVFSDE
jgi:hypothetical protein